MKLSVALLAVIAAIGDLAAADKPREITLPPETEVYRTSDLPGYALVNAMCLTCHSMEYVKYQPTTSPRAYWQATVVKMQKVFGAPIPDPMIEPLVDYLTRTYGNERPPEASQTSPQAARDASK